MLLGNFKQDKHEIQFNTYNCLKYFPFSSVTLDKSKHAFRNVYTNDNNGRKQLLLENVQLKHVEYTPHQIPINNTPKK